MNKQIPRHVTEHHLTDAGDLTFYGVPAPKLSRDELLAMVNGLAAELRELRQKFMAISVAARYSLTD